MPTYIAASYNGIKILIKNCNIREIERTSYVANLFPSVAKKLGKHAKPTVFKIL